MAIDYGLVLAIVLTTAMTISSIITFLMLTAPTPYCPKELSSPNGKLGNDNDTATIVVLGDIGRSPRMQYHALSFAKHGVRVQLVGYNESSVHPDIESNRLVSIVPLSPYPSALQTTSWALFPLVAPLKVLFQFFNLYYILGYVALPSRWILVQNPPSIPTLPVALVVAFLRRSRLVIDWHNYGFTILATKLGHSHPLVSWAKKIEIFFGSLGNIHFTVTDVMSQDLLQLTRGKARALALHDRPNSIYQPLTFEERGRALRTLEPTSDLADELQTGRRELVMSSTSWTPDEDFSILLESLVMYYQRYQDRLKGGGKVLPSLLVIITGKGPLKGAFEKQVQMLVSQGQLPEGSPSPSSSPSLSPIIIRTAWLSAADYALLLGCASVGVSLHTSSSGLDLPMKVVDMFGAGLPVVAYAKDFPALSELVKEGVNGRGFRNASELEECLSTLFEGDQHGHGPMLEILRTGATAEGNRRWDVEWDQTAGRVFGIVAKWKD